MKRYIVVRRASSILEDAIRLLEIDVDQYMEEGYILADSLIHTASFNDDVETEWHILLQPMISNKEK